MSNTAFATSGSGGGGVTMVTATSPLASSGGSAPNISIASTIPVTLGGTGFAATTAYGLITGGTTATSPLQNAGTGTAGQVYISNGAGALGTWSSFAGSQVYQFIMSFTANNTMSAYAITGLSNTYSLYRIICTNIVLATDTDEIILRCSTNNGVSYDSGSNYQRNSITLPLSSSTTSTNAATTDTFINLTSGGAHSSNINNSDCTFYAPSTTNYAVFYKDYVYVAGASGWVRAWGTGLYSGGAPINAVQVSTLAGGNFTSGIIYVYGLLAT
jgi:hypothetical protein